MVTAMVDDYNALLTGNKRKIENMNESPSKKTCSLKERICILTQIQENMFELLKNKVEGVTQDEIEECKNVTSIKFVSAKRTVRNTPGIYTDNKKKYYINPHGTRVYKRPCGKPRKDMEWCHFKGEWVSPGSGWNEYDTSNMNPNDTESVNGSEEGNEVFDDNDEYNIPPNGGECVDTEDSVEYTTKLNGSTSADVEEDDEDDANVDGNMEREGPKEVMSDEEDSDSDSENT